MKSVRCIETGKVYQTATDAARDVGVTVGMIGHVLKGRQKTAAGYTWEYVPYREGIHTPRKWRPRRWIRDDSGNIYENYKTLAVVKGMSQSMAHRLVNADPDGMFRNEWLLGRKPLPPSRMLMYKCKVEGGTIRFGPAGWYLDKKQDLFACLR